MKWILEDREKSREVCVFNDEDPPAPKVRKWLIYSTGRVEFRLLQEMHKAKVPAYDGDDNPVLDESGKQTHVEMLVPKRTVGYLLKYKYNENYPKFSTFNTFGIVYNKKDNVPKKDVELNLINEDKVVRLLAYEHKNKNKDYWLIGRWRQDNSNGNGGEE